MDGDLSHTCVVSQWSLEVNTVMRNLKCYNIGGNNLFQLRELAPLFDYGITYDEETDTVYLTTK